MKKKAQYDDFNEYNSLEPVSDRENWEEEQVFQDQQAENEDQFDELTNTGEPPMSQEQLAAMHSKELGAAILTWHGGQASPLYSLGSTLAAGKQITSEMALNGIGELKSLLTGTADPQLTPGDRIEIENIMSEIDNRFLEPEREERRLDAQTQESLQEERMFPTGPEDTFGSNEKEVKIAWVHKNCQFIRTAKMVQAFTLAFSALEEGKFEGNIYDIAKNVADYLLKFGIMELMPGDIERIIGKEEPSRLVRILNRIKRQEAVSGVSLLEAINAALKERTQVQQPEQPQKVIEQDPFEAYREKAIKQRVPKSR